MAICGSQYLHVEMRVCMTVVTAMHSKLYMENNFLLRGHSTSKATNAPLGYCQYLDINPEDVTEQVDGHIV